MKYFVLLVFVALSISSGFAQFPFADLPNEIIVEGLVDGPSYLHLSEDGIYWTNGPNAKPGLIQGNGYPNYPYPTYVNGKEWMPKWGVPGNDRGEDTSNTFPLKLDPSSYLFELISVGEKRGYSLRNNKGKYMVAAESKNGELVVSIPDPQPGARWYKMRFKLKPKK